MSQKPNISSPVYVIDWLNQWSDFREIKYKLLNIDFHTVKHTNKEKDTFEFFDVFFNKYLQFININNKSTFIFVMKKLSNYDKLLYSILEIYKHINIRFIIIENRYTNELLDKNKDDFLCQYIFSYYRDLNDCILISNDQYRDKQMYIKEFNSLKSCSIRMLKKNGQMIENIVVQLNIDTKICDNILQQSCNRKTIPKNKLFNIIG
jgi:hypothetical protein